MAIVTWRRAVLFGAVSAALGGIGSILADEVRTSSLQAAVFSGIAGELTWRVEPGPSDDIRFPAGGPYDTRFGYADLPRLVERLGSQGYDVASQSRPSADLARFVDRFGYAVYPEKTRAGLVVEDRGGKPLFAAQYPGHAFASFADIPPPVLGTLLFVENREALDADVPTRNPAVEWDRFALASVGVITKPVLGAKWGGGSTLATQVEKFRHSAGGQTTSPVGKLKQMMMASVRAYADGSDTTAARRRIVLDYLNSTPMSARGGFGEVNGLGDGLHTWFGADFERAMDLLRRPPAGAAEAAERALAYRQTLSLLLAQRRPTHYLLAGRGELDALVDSYLRLLGGAQIIDPDLAQGALQARVEFKQPPAAEVMSFVEQKAATAIRTKLMGLLDEPGLYPLDRLDLTVRTTIDGEAERKVTEVLRGLSDPATLKRLGLVDYHLLDHGDPANVVWSVAFLERGATAHRVLVQADNADKPLDITDGAKLDLGSTAKVRTLATYLGIVVELNRRYAQLGAGELRQAQGEAADPLTRWAIGYIGAAKDRSLKPMLAAAMERRYSGSTGEHFFTGGGLHTFANFEKSEDFKIWTVAEALRESVNLPFIRLMRDIVAFYEAEGDERPIDVLRDRDHPARQAYLEDFADQEGSAFLSHFIAAYRGKPPDEMLGLAAAKARAIPDRVAVIFRSVAPEASLADFSAFMTARLPGADLGAGRLSALYERYAPGKFNLADRGYLARLHPLELWLLAYLRNHPTAGRAEILAASADERQDAYAWLFKTHRKAAQDKRIRIRLEEEAFQRIHETWARLGYPFDSLVPSYATAIGSSADRPGALAELMGIILDGGMRKPIARIERLCFAEDTPYETTMTRGAATPERVMEPEVAETVRAILLDVVERGTARRAKGAFIGADGKPLPLGGKTGTGDHRFDVFAAGGRMIESHVVDRTATFAFFVGERHFGVITAHVHGPEAANYKFTSALSAQLLKALAPVLRPLILADPAPAAVALK